MRAKNEYKFLEEAYSQVNEGFDKVGEKLTRKNAAQGAVPADPGSALARAFRVSLNAEGPPNPGPDDLGPDRESERPPVQVGSHVMWDKQRQFGIVDRVDDPENPTVAVMKDDDGAESLPVDVEDLEEISGPIEDQEDDHDRHLEPSHGHGAAYVEDDPEDNDGDYWTPEGLEVGRRVTYETSKGNQSTGKVLEIGQDVVKIRDELAGEEKEILIKDILEVHSELGKGPELPPGHPLR